MTAFRTNWVYIATNDARKPLYHGSTWGPATRWDEHLRGIGSATIRRYGLYKVVWFKAFEDKETALTVEYRLKRKSRARKLPMIEAFNPNWRDMSAQWLREAAREWDWPEFCPRHSLPRSGFEKHHETLATRRFHLVIVPDNRPRQ